MTDSGSRGSSNATSVHRSFAHTAPASGSAHRVQPTPPSPARGGSGSVSGSSGLTTRESGSKGKISHQA